MIPAETATIAAERFRIRNTIEALEMTRARELASLTEAEAFRIIGSLRLFAGEWNGQPADSGLLEQQRLFLKARNRQEPNRDRPR